MGGNQKDTVAGLEQTIQVAISGENPLRHNDWVLGSQVPQWWTWRLSGQQCCVTGRRRWQRTAAKGHLEAKSQTKSVVFVVGMGCAFSGCFFERQRVLFLLVTVRGKLKGHQF